MSAASFSRRLDVGKKALVQISQDNRIHLHDIESGREKRSIIEKQHLARSYICSAWSNSGDAKSASGFASLGSFAVGTSDEHIIVWDLERGQVSKNIKVDGGNALDVRFSNDAKSVLAATSNANIVKYDIATGQSTTSVLVGKKAALKVAVNPKQDNVIAFANTSIRIVDLENPQKKKKLEASLPGGALALEFSSCGRFLAVSSSGSREVLVFDVQAGAPDTPIAVIPLDDVPISLSMRSVSKKSSVAIISIYTQFENNRGALVYVQRNAEQNVSHNVIRIKGDNGILTAAFGSMSNVNSSTVLTLAIGQASKPRFQEVSMEDNEGNIVDEIQIQSVVSTNANTNIGDSSVTSNKVSNGPAAVLGPLDAGGVKRPLINGNDDNDEEQRKKTKTESLTTSTQSLDKLLESVSEELTKRENQWKQSLKQSQNVSFTSDDLLTIIANALNSTSEDKNNNGTTLDALSRCEDYAIMEETARRLDSTHVVPLLKRMIAMFDKSPSAGFIMTRWIQTILRHHTGHLASIPDLMKQLNRLGIAMEERLVTYSRLASLTGRMDLLMNLIGQQQQ